MKKKIAVLGCTGSIGSSAFRAIDSVIYDCEIIIISAFGSRIEKIKQQCSKYKPKYLILDNESLFDKIKIEFPNIILLNTENGYDTIANNEEIDVTIVGIVGISGMIPTIKMAKCSKILAVANKEAIIYGGKIMLDYIKKCNSRLVPIDSEHNSIHQIFQKINIDNVKKVIITSSGGSLKNYTGDFNDVTIDQVLAHPKWRMGYKCTIDSAHMINKGLEIIEASILFGLHHSKIEAIIHPEVIIHAMVEMLDNSIFSFMSNPDMSIHLANCITDGNYLLDCVEPIDFIKLKSMNFFDIDHDRFLGIKIARDVIEAGDAHIIGMNASDEVLVQAFIDRKISFKDITNIMLSVLEKLEKKSFKEIEEIINYDKIIKKLTINKINQYD